MRKFLNAICTAAIVVMPFLATVSIPTMVRAASVGLIKGPGPTIYWNATNGKRYVFPTYGTYWSWYGFTEPSIQELSTDELGAIPIGGNVTYKPGVRMLKITTDPKVYAVGRYGELHWITSEDIAAKLYGADWMHRIHDMPDEFFVNYTIGTPITSADQFDPGSQMAAVATPDDDIGTPPAAPAPTPAAGGLSTISVTLTPDKISVAESDTLRYSAAVTDSDGIASIQIYVNGAVSNTCDYTVPTQAQGCGVSGVASTLEDENHQIAFSTRAVDDLGNVTWSDLRVIGVGSTYPVFTEPAPAPTPAPTTGARFTNTISKTSVTEGETVTLTATLNPSGTAPAIAKIDILDPRTALPIQTCSAQTSCSASITLVIRLGVTNIIFHARGYDASGKLIAEEWFPTVSISPQATSKTYAVSLSEDTNAITSGDSVTLTASASASPTLDMSGTKIEIWDNVRKTLVRTCTEMTSCVVSLSVIKPETSSYGQYVAYVKDTASGMIKATGYAPLISFNGAVVTTTGQLAVDKTSHASGEMILLTFSAPSSIPVDHVRAVFYNENLAMSIWSCGGLASCSGSVADWSNGFATNRYYVKVYDRAPGTSGDGTYVTTVYSPTITYTTYTVCPSNICTYQFTKGPLAPAATPVITSPTAYQTFTNFPRTMTVVWSNTGAPRYRIHVSCDSSCWPVVGINSTDAYLTPRPTRHRCN